ncbi:hornerin [Musca vetustissima]|uniref:hornerin n=1 Tax=Musca vetustissima TaxID=27455 RepID=UPI002AB7B97C|nr:hornerin [Musca vetustissima]
MRRFSAVLIFWLVATVVRADISDKLEKKSVDQASDKSSDAKPKRDASFLVGNHGSYHGPSYKYLPPSPGVASSYDSYSGSSSLGGGHHHRHHSSLGGGLKFVGVSHGSYPGSYASGPSYTSSLGGHGSGFGHAIKSSGPSYVIGGHGVGHGASSSSSFGAGHGYAHGFSSGPKVITAVPSYSLSAGHIGAGSGLAGGYHYSKGISGSLPTLGGGHGGFGGSSGVGHGISSGHGGFSSSGIGHAVSSGHGGFSSSSGAGHAISGFGGSGFSAQGGYSSGGHSEVHHSDHVHNGNQEHHYIVSTTNQNSGVATQSSDSGYQYEAPAATYLPPVIPSNSYGLPISAVSATYTPQYQDSGDEAPVYAAGHKGLGHFSFTSNKPNVLHTNFIGSGFKTPSYSKVPFKPSTFLGTKFEGSSSSSSGAGAGVESPNQQYLPPSSGGSASEASGYDYPIPSGATLEYHDTSYQSDAGLGNHQQPEANYLPPHDSSATPNANYLPPSGSSYGH